MTNTIIEEALLRARVMRPYYAAAIEAITPIPTPGLGTCAVDTSWRLYYDPEWLAALPPAQQGGIIAGHEIEHLLRRHSARRGLRDPTAFNIACDAAINDDCNLPLPEGAIFPAELKCADGNLEEEYYDAALQLSKLHSCGSGAGGLPLSCELPQVGGLTETEADVIRSRVAADVREYAKRHPGNVPNSIVMWANEEAAPVRLDWRRELQARVHRKCRVWSRGREDYDRSRLSRRARPMMPLRPGMRQPLPTIHVVVDTSGSMSNVGAEVLGVMKSLHKRHIGRMLVWSCDTQVNRVRDGTYRGGGGTDLRVGLREASKGGDILVVITDGETPWPDEAPPVPCIAVIIGDVDAPTWAEVIRVPAGAPV